MNARRCLVAAAVIWPAIIAILFHLEIVEGAKIDGSIEFVMAVGSAALLFLAAIWPWLRGGQQR